MELMEVQVSEEVRAGYKRTEVGVIPEDWEVVPLRGLGIFSKGQGIKRSDVHEAGLPCVRYGELYTVHNDVVRQFHSFITSAIARTSRRLQQGDLLFAGSGETKEEIGKCAAFVDDVEAYAGGDIVILSLRGADPVYFGYLMNAPEIVRQKASLGQGDAVVHISGTSLSKVLAPVPTSKAEQRAIATALSDADALIGSLEQLVAKKQAIKQGALQALLTPPGQPGHKRLPGYGGVWGVKRLGDVLKFQVGSPFSSMYFNEKCMGIRLIKNRDLKADDQVFHYNGPYDKSFLVSDGDVLIGMDGDFLPCRWNKGTALLNQRVGRVMITGSTNLVFLYYYLIAPLKVIESVTSSTTVKHLSHGDVEGIEVPLPTIDEQTAIATVLFDMDAELTALEEKLAKLRAVKQGMMQELLTGRKRLGKSENK